MSRLDEQAADRALLGHTPSTGCRREAGRAPAYLISRSCAATQSQLACGTVEQLNPLARILAVLLARTATRVIPTTMTTKARRSPRNRERSCCRPSLKPTP